MLKLRRDLSRKTEGLHAGAAPDATDSRLTQIR